MEKMEVFFNGCLFTIYLLVSFVNFFGTFDVGGFDFGNTDLKRYGFSFLFLLIAMYFLYDTLK